MNNKFFEDTKKELINDPNMEYNVSVTENGGLGYRTTGKSILDTFYKISSLREADDEDIKDIWNTICKDNFDLAVQFLFFVGDIRGGVGERKVFRTMFKEFCTISPQYASYFISLVPEYSRWDILWDLIGINEMIDISIRSLVLEQIAEDRINMELEKPISLLGKWLPSYNTSSAETKMKAKKLVKLLYSRDISNPIVQKGYRHTLSSLRKYLKVVERTISANEWDKVNYEAVPSKANLLYKDAFYKHDEDRYKKYLQDLSEGKAKVNASVAFPVDIVSKYYNNDRFGRLNRAMPFIKEEDTLLEEMWKALPNYNTGDENDDTVCVLDTSGSMGHMLNNSTTVLMLAMSIVAYFVDHSKSDFTKNVITYSANPSLINLEDCKSLADKLNKMSRDEDNAYNTDIEKVFDLILNTAIKNNYKQEDIPSRILVVSDMEFDQAFRTDDYASADARIFSIISKKYEDAGYKLPKLVFWNTCSRTNTIPVVENEAGVILVSGYSANVMKMVLSDRLDPMDALLDMLGAERYDIVREKLTEAHSSIRG